VWRKPRTWRSEDGGSSWGDMSDLGYSYDFQKMTADLTTGRFAGRLYIAALHGYPEYLVSVFRSEDDGRTWRGPVQAASGRGEIGIGAVNAVVLSDGTLVLPIVEYEFKPEKAQLKGKIWRPMSLVLSTDGGVSFGPPKKAPAAFWDLDDPAWRRAVGNAQFAADTSSAPYRDRLYMVWPDSRHGRSRLLFARSSNRGANWSEPVLLDGSVPADSLQFQVAIAVNKDGVLGVSWYDTRHALDGSGFDEYFAASVDGGKSFLPSVRVSSESSRFVGQGNMRMDPIVSAHKDELYLSLLSAGSRWGGGGDYMGLAAGADGAFFPFWADSRTGTFQAYTARIAVEIPGKKDKSAPEPALAAAAPRAAVSLKDRVELVFDPTRFDMASNEAEIPIRLRNVSREPIYPPITLEITAFDYDDPDVAKSEAPPPRIVNAANGQSGAGAKFDFSGALGNLGTLPPGGLTGPVFARFQYDDPTKTGPIRFRVEGMVDDLRAPGQPEPADKADKKENP